MRKAVLDTNIFVSSLLTRTGPTAQVLSSWRHRRYLLVTSPAIIAEIRAVLQHPRIRRRYSITDEEAEELVTLLEQEALIVPGNTRIPPVIPEDPADEQVLACAIEAGADCIVSGDRHLLNLKVYAGIPILTTREFLDWLEKE